ncbi:MAG: carboxypeptidase-like regulatory domain-containing protein [Thermoguttaceae bacterium]
MKRRLFFATMVLGLFGSVVHTGCQEAGQLSGLAKCSGILTYKGEPVSEATITFVPASQTADSRAGGAISDASGGFQATTLRPGDGLAPGEYIVLVSKYEFQGPELPPVKQPDGEMAVPSRPQKNILPAKYMAATTSSLKVTIPAGGVKTMKLELAD